MSYKLWKQNFQNPPNSLGTLFWLHGTETEDQLWKAFRNAIDSGLGELVLESRPHWDYLGPKWWSDLKLILRWSAKENIKVYLFDEKWYPSGIAGGTIQKLDPSFKRVSIRYQSIKYRGPQSRVSIMPPWTKKQTSSILGMYAYPTVEGKIIWKEYIDLTERLSSDYSLHMHGIFNAVTWDVPEGDWTIVFIIADRSDNYIDPMNPDAVNAFINRVFETSRTQLSEYWAKTLVGFFFDEPGFFNEAGRIPWSSGLRKIFMDRKGYDPMPLLALLWIQQGAHPFKYDFYEVLNSTFAETFHKPIQEWCHMHDLKLIGHWYEHEACPSQGERFMFHEGLQDGPGDFFEVSKYVDEGGIDLVCNQIIPGERNRDYWGLPKLGSSTAHVYNMKEDLAFSETFGAYGWHLGLRMMKWLTDWQAVRGINHFILHAFNPKYPDLDCPPYYFDGGNNPQWPYFAYYVKYVNRLSHFLRGGRHVAPLLVLYPGAMGYAGQVFPTEDTQRFLQEIQYDYDLVSAGILINDAVVKGTQLAIHKEDYQGVLISGQEVLTTTVLDKLQRIADSGIAVIFLYQAPEMIITGSNTCDIKSRQLEKLLQNRNVSVVASHSELESCLSKHNIQPTVEFAGRGKECLRVLHRILEDNTDVWFLNNEDINETVRGQISLNSISVGEKIVALEPLTGESWIINALDTDKNPTFDISIPPYRSILLIVAASEHEVVLSSQVPAAYRELTQVSQVIDIPSESVALHWKSGQITGLPSWLSLERSYSGTLEYSWDLDIDNYAGDGEFILDLGEVHEIVEVEVNKTSVGFSIVPPYRFDIKSHIKKGVNQFNVKVTNIVSNKMRNNPEFEDTREEWKKTRDMVSIETEGGLIGPVKIYIN